MTTDLHDLSAALATGDPGAIGAALGLPTAPTLPDRLRALIAEGLEFSAALSIFTDHQKATKPHLSVYRDNADSMSYVREGEVEVDDNAIVSKGDGAGAYVLGWVWVEDEAAGIEREADK